MGEFHVSLLSGIQAALKSPNLGEDRRSALWLLAKVAETGGLAFYPREPEPDVNGLLAQLSGSRRCVNCGNQVESTSLYCGEFCNQICKDVRYIRGCIADGRVWRPDIQSAIGTRLLMLNGGGYPAIDRKITRTIRKRIFARDGGRCVCCGEPATEIDHISGSSNDSENLRAICGTCNKNKAFADACPATPVEKKAINAMMSEMAKRIASPVPLKVCDYAAWKNIWRKLGNARAPN